MTLLRLAMLAAGILACDRSARPEIRLTVESRQDAVVYRFDVPPGADPRAIRMRYAGADDLRVEDDGRALRIHAGTQTLREHGLRCFQDAPGGRRHIACRYAVARSADDPIEVAFDIGPYDHTRALIIDPEIG